MLRNPIFFSEEKEQKCQGTKGSKYVVPLVNVSQCSRAAKCLFAAVVSLVGGCLLMLLLEKTSKDSGMGQRIYSSFNNVLMPKYIWYVASVNFKQLSLGRNKFSDLHLLKYNPELSCSAGHKIRQIHK